jgi:hypothetical protein
VLDKVVYALAHPVSDQLVERVFDWPGASSLRYTRAWGETWALGAVTHAHFAVEPLCMVLDPSMCDAAPPPVARPRMGSREEWIGKRSGGQRILVYARAGQQPNEPLSRFTQPGSRTLFCSSCSRGTTLRMKSVD